METLSRTKLRKNSPVKWHDKIPTNGISLGVADIDFKGPPGINEYIRDNIREEFSFYQARQGLPEALTIASEFLNSKGVPAASHNIQVIEGTMMGIFAAMRWIASREGELVISGPTYPPIHEHASRNGNKIKWVDMKDNFEDQLVTTVNKDTKMIVLCNPNNPTGYIYTEQELKLIADLASDFNCHIFSDELYEPLTFDKKHYSMASIPGAAERSILLYGFSKAYGLAGYRSGFMYIGSHQEEVQSITNELLVSPSPFSSLVLQYALQDERMKAWIKKFVSIIKSNTKLAADLFNDAGIACEYPEANFFVFPNINVDDIAFEEFLLKNTGVQVVAGSKFGPMGKHHIRINCATSENYLIQGIVRIIAALEQSNE